jgi:hypothetical protein
MSTITETARHFYGHGQAWLFPRTAGGVIDGTVATALSLPEVDSIELNFETEKVTRVSKRDSMASKAVSFVKMLGGKGKITCSQHTMDLLALYGFGTKSTVAGGSVSAVAFVPASGIVAGAIVPFPGDRTNLTTFTSIVDSAGSPLTLVNGTDYEVDNQAGVVKFINVPGTQPYKLTGTQDAGSQVAGFTSRVQEKWLRHKVINIAENDDYGVLDVYRIQIDPAAAWQLVSDGNEPQKYEISFEILKDTTKSSTATGGQYFRYVE